MILEESRDTTDDKQNKTNTSQRQSFIEELNLHSEGPPHKKYGNMLVLL